MKKKTKNSKMALWLGLALAAVGGVLLLRKGSGEVSKKAPELVLPAPITPTTQNTTASTHQTGSYTSSSSSTTATKTTASNTTSARRGTGSAHR